jgi:hypothetical protein
MFVAAPLSSAEKFIAIVEAGISSQAATQATGPTQGMTQPTVGGAAPVSPAQQVYTPAAQRPAEQLIRVYRGKDCSKQFERDAKKLARKGWQVQSHSYGGQTSKAGAVLAFGLLGLGAGSKPREITVIYVRG